MICSQDHSVQGHWKESIHHDANSSWNLMWTMFFMSGLSEFIWPWFPPFFSADFTHIANRLRYQCADELWFKQICDTVVLLCVIQYLRIYEARHDFKVDDHPKAYSSPSNGTASWNWRLITHNYITQRTSSTYQKFPGSRAWEIVGSIFPWTEICDSVAKVAQDMFPIV